MAKKEFIKLLEENISILDRLADRVRREPAKTMGYTRQQLVILIRLHMAGRVKLKDIARHEQVTTSNLCMLFRKLESDGLIIRDIDDNDRRNTWYSLSQKGTDIAVAAKEELYSVIAEMFSDISKEDEGVLIHSLKTINNILHKMEDKNA